VRRVASAFAKLATAPQRSLGDCLSNRGGESELAAKSIAAEILARRKREAGMEDRSEIETMFQFIDADEGRLLVGNQKLQPAPD